MTADTFSVWVEEDFISETELKRTERILSKVEQFKKPAPSQSASAQKETLLLDDRKALADHSDQPT